MKLSGHNFERPSIEVVVIPRGIDAETGEDLPDIVFKCAPVKSFEEFDLLVPVPTAPEVIRPGGKRTANTDDSGFQGQIAQRATKRIAYMVIKSLQATEGLEWETIKLSEPRTWLNYEKELQEAGFAINEINRILNGVFSANALNQGRMDEALANFRLGQQEAKADTSGHQTEPNSTPSGEPASD